MDEQNYTARTMPYSLEAEQSILGSIILDRDCISSVVEKMGEKDFYSAQNREIFSAMLELYNANKPIDVVTLKEQLTIRGTFDKVGGLAYIVHVADIVPTTASVKYYTQIVAEKAKLRDLIGAATDIVNIGFEANDHVDVIMDKAEKKIFDVVSGRESRHFVLVKDAIKDSFNRLQELQSSGKKITGVPSGFGSLDRVTKGFQKSDLILIAARPAMGKTAFALNIAQHAAIRGNVPVAIFSLEMSAEQLVTRLLCSEAMVESEKLRVGDLDQNDWDKLIRAVRPLSEAQIYIDDTPDISVSQMRAKCRRLKLEKGLGLIVIDYLQLMQNKGRNENRQQEISDISRSLKILAKELDVPVITLSQLSRAPEQRADHRPMLSDLRESGAIEQDADIVMFLYRDEYYNEDTEKKGIAECIISKHRNGSTDSVELFWVGKYTRFTDLDRAH